MWRRRVCSRSSVGEMIHKTHDDDAAADAGEYEGEMKIPGHIIAI